MPLVAPNLIALLAILPTTEVAGPPNTRFLAKKPAPILPAAFKIVLPVSPGSKALLNADFIRFLGL